MTRRDLCESTQYAESLSFFLQGAHSPRGAAGHALHRCAGLLKGGKRAGGKRAGGERAGGERAGGEKPAPGFDRAALSATTAPEPQTRAAHQRDAARAPGTTGRRAGPGFAAGHAQGTPRAGNVLPPGPRIRLYIRRIDESTNRRIVYCPMVSNPWDRDPVPKVQGPVQEDSEKSERAAVPPNPGTAAALPLPAGTRRVRLWPTDSLVSSGVAFSRPWSPPVPARSATSLGQMIVGQMIAGQMIPFSSLREKVKVFLICFLWLWPCLSFSLVFRGRPARGGGFPPSGRPGEGGGECSSPTLSRRDGPRPGPFSGPDGGHVTSRP